MARGGARAQSGAQNGAQKSRNCLTNSARRPADKAQTFRSHAGAPRDSIPQRLRASVVGLHARVTRKGRGDGARNFSSARASLIFAFELRTQYGPFLRTCGLRCLMQVVNGFVCVCVWTEHAHLT